MQWREKPMGDGQAVSLSDPPPRVRGWWLAFPPAVDEDAARRRFTERFGREPQQVVRTNGLLLLGPVDTEPFEGPG